MSKDYYVKENLINTVEHKSPNSENKLIINYYKTEDKCWNFTEGVLLNPDKKKNTIAIIKRNYHSFWFCFVIRNNKEYLLCGEDYQGYSVIDCENGERIDYLYPYAHTEGVGFCWVSCEQTSETVIRVEGCYWACPFEVVELDITDVMHLPYKEISRRNLYDE